MYNTFLFIGEKRSQKAIKMRVRWKNGKLAAKQLFDALYAVNINLSQCEFINLFTDSTGSINYKSISKIKKSNSTVIALGRVVSNCLSNRGIKHIYLIHPAARGKIRKKENYIEHVKSVLL